MQLVVVLAVIGGVGAVAAGYVRGGMSEPTSSLPDGSLPEGRIDVHDLAGVRFSMALRGYRMSEVDDVLARLGDELAERDAEITRLRGG